MINFILKRKNILQNILPKTLYGRSFVIIVIPTLMVQIFALFIFDKRHWKNITISMSNTLKNEINLIIDTHKKSPTLAKKIADKLIIKYTHIPNQKRNIQKPSIDKTGDIFVTNYIKQKHEYYPIIRLKKPNDIFIILYNDYEQFIFVINEYRLYSNVTKKLMWVFTITAGIIFSIISIIIARNQAIPIQQLSTSLIEFSKGDTKSIEKLNIRGSNEIRSAIYNSKIMSERIIRQNKQRTNILSGISHDIRTPLTRIKLILTLMKNEPNKQKIIDNVTDIDNLIKLYLEFVYDINQQSYNYINLGDEIQILVNKWKATQQNINFIYKDKISHTFKKILIIRMIENIISNAVKYGTIIDIILERQANNAIISIIDNGCGIDEEKLHDMFKPFVRGEPSRNKSTGGTGLGLSIALDIAYDHGGNIILENRQQQKGLITKIILPISQKD